MTLKGFMNPEQLLIYDNHRHFVGTYDINSHIITADRLIEWVQDPNREYHCIYCNSKPEVSDNFMWCKRCNEYKGISPNCN